MDSAANNGGREEKKTGGKEAKANPASGGAAKKRMKSKKANAPKGHNSESLDDRMLQHQQQLFQFQGNTHNALHSQHSQIVSSQGLKGLGLLSGSNNAMMGYPNVKAELNHKQPNDR